MAERDALALERAAVRLKCHFSAAPPSQEPDICRVFTFIYKFATLIISTMGKIKTGLTLGSLTLLGLLGVLFAFWYTESKTSERLGFIRAQSDLATLSKQRGGMTIPLGAQTMSSGNKAESSLAVNGGSGTSAQPTTTQTVNPKSFSTYNQYQDSADALYADITRGTGTEVGASTKVAIRYSGWLTDGTLFDQTKPDAKGDVQPFVFTMGQKQIIVGMEQGVLGMKVGGKRLVVIPPAVGYGAAGQGSIPANAVLIFEVELVDAL